MLFEPGGQLRPGERTRRPIRAGGHRANRRTGCLQQKHLPPASAVISLRVYNGIRVGRPPRYRPVLPKRRIDRGAGSHARRRPSSRRACPETVTQAQLGHHSVSFPRRGTSGAFGCRPWLPTVDPRTMTRPAEVSSGRGWPTDQGVTHQRTVQVGSWQVDCEMRAQTDLPVTSQNVQHR